MTNRSMGAVKMKINNKQQQFLMKLLLVSKHTLITSANGQRLFCGFIPGGLIVYKDHADQRISKVCKIEEFLEWAGKSAKIIKGAQL